MPTLEEVQQRQIARRNEVQERIIRAALIRLAVAKRRVMGSYQRALCIRAGYVAHLVDSKSGVWFTDKGVEYVLSFPDDLGVPFYPQPQDIAEAKAKLSGL